MKTTLYNESLLKIMLVVADMNSWMNYEMMKLIDFKKMLLRFEDDVCINQ